MLPYKKRLTFSLTTIADVKEHVKARLDSSNPGLKNNRVQIYREKYSEILEFSPQKWSFFEVGKRDCDKTTGSIPV